MRLIPTIKYYSATKRNKILIHAATWMNLENMLSEISQVQKANYCIISLALGNWNREIPRERRLPGYQESYDLMSTEFLSEMMKIFWSWTAAKAIYITINVLKP